ncbi:MAG TPA: carbamate kinase, partial [Actinomycetota bacterium]|nr:carbamate kinase [Actinomycetota bacterium]
RQGWEVAITHGNGPQVGFILRRSELASHELHEVPLDVCGADSQGAIGYALQQNLYNDFARLGIHKPVTTVITQTEVEPDDPAFQRPTKPIGSYMDQEQAVSRRTHDGWSVIEDAGRGWCRVVPSPLPGRIVEEDVIRTLLAQGIVVISAGGGGIPVVTDAEGNLRGVAAVIDKDLASSLLASRLGAELLLISTSVEKVALRFGTPEQEWVSELPASAARSYLEEGGHFAKGSMAPKIQAAVSYVEATGGTAIITDPDNVERALDGDTGTRIVPD